MEFTPQFFDDASKAWKANKVRIGEGHYRYRKNAFASEKPIQVKVIQEQRQIQGQGPRRSPRFTASK